MTFDFLPPQAYTKETLLKAYNWLQSQSDQVKELATTPDQLVSLFLKSSRLGQESLQRFTNSSVSTYNSPTPAMPTSSLSSSDQNERPSLQSFKSELKNLAGIMGDLEKPQVAAAPNPPPTAPAPYNSNNYQGQYQAPLQAYQGPYSSAANGTTVNATQVSSAPQHDETTQNLIREVKNELNLSSDSEALRMLVKIGYQKVRSLYK